MSRDKDKNVDRNVAILRLLVAEFRAAGVTHISVDTLDAAVTQLEQRHAR